MINIKDEKIRAFCEPVLNVNYVAGRGIETTYIDSENQLVELKLLYSFCDFRESKGQQPFLELKEDNEGKTYALLTLEGIDYAISNRFSIVHQIHKNLNTVPLRKAKKVPTTESLEETVIEEMDKDSGMVVIFGKDRNYELSKN